MSGVPIQWTGPSEAKAGAGVAARKSQMWECGWAREGDDDERIVGIMNLDS